MLYMVIERFPAYRDGYKAVGELFASRGRMMPEGSGLVYIASWMASDGSGCYQLMEAPSREAFDQWMRNWSSVTEFEVVQVEPSADFWKRVGN
jgi:hypothetical protein